MISDDIRYLLDKQVKRLQWERRPEVGEDLRSVQ